MPNRTFPKDGIRKLKEVIRDLRAQINGLEKENRILRQEIDNIVKPVRNRKPHTDTRKLTSEEWRKDFVRKFKESMKRNLNED